MQNRNLPGGGERPAAVPVETDRRDSADKGQMSVIGMDIVITGNIEASVDLHIEGKVVGDVRCATLILGESSSVNGRVYATRVKVSGTLEGALETKDLAIESGARVSGDISYERLRIANGGIIDGSVTRRVAEGEAEEGSKLKLVGPASVEPDAAKGS